MSPVWFVAWMVVGAVGVLGTISLPFLFPTLGILYFSSTLLGTAFMLIHIGMNSVIGAHGGPEHRAVNFSWLALGFSISGSLGPIVAGVAIDRLGFTHAFGVLSLRIPQPVVEGDGREPGSGEESRERPVGGPVLGVLRAARLEDDNRRAGPFSVLRRQIDVLCFQRSQLQL